MDGQDKDPLTSARPGRAQQLHLGEMQPPLRPWRHQVRKDSRCDVRAIDPGNGSTDRDGDPGRSLRGLFRRRRRAGDAAGSRSPGPPSGPDEPHRPAGGATAPGEPGRDEQQQRDRTDDSHQGERGHRRDQPHHAADQVHCARNGSRTLCPALAAFTPLHHRLAVHPEAPACAVRHRFARSRACLPVLDAAETLQQVIRSRRPGGSGIEAHRSAPRGRPRRWRRAARNRKHAHSSGVHTPVEGPFTPASRGTAGARR